MTYFLVYLGLLILALAFHKLLCGSKSELEQMLEDEEQAEYLRNLK